jgi:hypothetical protein
MPEKPAVQPPPVTTPAPAPKPVEIKPVAPAPSPELEALKRELVRLAAEINTERTERDAQTAIVSDLTGKLNAATASQERITTELAAARQQHDEQLRQRDAQLHALTDLRTGAETARDAAFAQVEQLTQSLASAQAATAANTDALEKETSRLTAELATVRAEHDTLSRTITTLTARLTAAEQDLGLARADLIARNELLAAAETTRTEAIASAQAAAANEIDALKKEITRLGSELATQNERATTAETARQEALTRLEQRTAELNAERASAAEHQTRFAAELLAMRNESNAERAKAQHITSEQSALLTRQHEERNVALANTERERDAAKQLAARLEAEKHQLIEQHQRALADKNKELAAAREAAAKIPAVEKRETSTISVSDATAYRDPFRLMLRRVFLYVSVAALAVVGATLLMTRFAPETPPASATNATAKEPAPAPTRRETIEAQLDTGVIIDDLAITFSNPRVEPITLVSVLGSEMISDESYLVIDLVYSNQSTTSETILYQPWNNAELKDNTGRRFRPSLLGQTDVMHEVKGRILIHTLKPGEVMNDVILFPWRPGEAASFTLTADPDFRRVDDRDRAIQRSSTIIQLTMPLESISTGLRIEVVP